MGDFLKCFSDKESEVETKQGGLLVWTGEKAGAEKFAQNEARRKGQVVVFCPRREGRIEGEGGGR